MNRNSFFTVTMVFIIITASHSQPWVQNDAIYNPSGIPSLPFSQPRFADPDGDGDQDLIIGSVDENPYYLENTGDAVNPSFATGPDIFWNVDMLDAEMGVCCDIDHDNDLDFITGGFTGLNLYLNIGDASNPEFEKQEGFFNGLAVGNNPVPDFADIDGDSDPDMVVGFSESGMVKLYLNSGNSTAAEFMESNSVEVGDVGLYAYPVFCDLDNDNDFDLLVGKDDHGFIYYKNIGDPINAVWEADPTVFEGLGNATYWNSPSLADLNGDELPDLVFGSYAGPLNYFENTGTASVPDWQENTTLFGGVIDVGSASNPWFYDFDGDGDFDLFTGTQLGDIKYYENTGTITGPAWTENSEYFTSLKHSIYSAVAVGDVNDDGLPDAIVGDLSGNLYYHRNTGSGFELESGYLEGISLGGWSSPRLVDFDSDSDLDIIAGNEAGKLSYIQNEGTPQDPDWVEITGFFGSIDVGSNCVPAVCDPDFDDDWDILCGNISGDLTYFENQDGNWVENTEVFEAISGGQNTSPALADLDADGDPDLTLGQYSGIFNYFRNDYLVTGVSDPVQRDSQLNIKVYPNPCTQNAIILIESEYNSNFSLELLNMNGQVVLERFEKSLPKGNQKISLNLSGLPQGIYFLQFHSQGHTKVEKLVKL
ncbi:MAG: T9SS type A sorting domain-containing protein [Bacteroidales bacterium]|nr:T9SS type A sorting domain-containing protein [Bacteroidales bacterium]